MADNFYKEMLKEQRETNALLKQLIAAINASNNKK